MQPESVKVLLLCGDVEVATAVSASLGEARWLPQCQVVRVNDLAAALVRLENEFFDVLLVDAQLKGLAGVSGSNFVHDLAVEMAVVVLGRADDPDLTIDAIAAGAHDRVDINTATAAYLARTIRSAAERQRFVSALIGDLHGEAALRQQRAKELSPPLPLTVARRLGVPALRSAWPEEFGQCVEIYGELLDLTIEDSASNFLGSMGHKINNLASRMGARNAGPRDVVDVHRAALRAKLDAEPTRKVREYNEEGRLLILRLMGHLLSYYRSLTW